MTNKTLIEEIEQYINQLSPHIANRMSAHLLVKALAEIKAQKHTLLTEIIQTIENMSGHVRREELLTVLLTMRDNN